MVGTRAPIAAALRALASQPLVHRHIARAFALLLDARRACFFPGDGMCIAQIGTDERGTELRRYPSSALELKSFFLGNGPDGLLPIADADPGYWVSVRLGDNPPLGGIVLLGLTDPPNREELLNLDAFIDLAMHRIYSDREVRLARHKANTDPLTGAYRREARDEVLSSMTSYAVAIVDLDGFKILNDTQGHAAGDRHLQKTAKALQRVVRPGDAVFRWGGDEFVVVMASSGAESLATRLEKTLKVNQIPASIGAVAVPAEALEWDSAFELADQKMYADKHRPGKKSRK